MWKQARPRIAEQSRFSRKTSVHGPDDDASARPHSLLELGSFLSPPLPSLRLRLRQLSDDKQIIEAMAPLSIMSRALARSAMKQATTVRTISSTPAVLGSSSTFSSPFKGESNSTKVPDFSKYIAGKSSGNALFSYFMVGTLGAISAAGAKSTIQGELR